METSKATDVQLYKFLYLLSSIGARPCDVLTLKYENINLTERTLKIKISKTSREIIFPIYEILLNFILTEYPKIDEQNLDKKLFGDEKLFIISRKFLKLKKDLSLKKEYNLKTFRKHFATSLIEQGIDGSIVAYLLGHTSVNTTSKYYINKKTDNIRISLNGLKL